MNKIIGILSGSGPEAGLHICQYMHKYLQIEYNAINDQDYPKYVLYNRPLLGFDETGIIDKSLVKHDFLRALHEINEMGSSHIIIACNTLHLLLDDVPEQIKYKICNMVLETVKKCSILKTKNVLVLGSSTSRQSNLYGNFCDELNISYVHPSEDEQLYIDTIIKNIMGGLRLASDAIYLENIINYYYKNTHIDGCIIGCTELPLIVSKTNSIIRYFDPNTIIAEFVIDMYKSTKQLPQ